MSIRSQKSVFLKALDIECPVEQRKFLEQACSGDEALIGAVSALLKEHNRETNPIDQPIAVAELEEQIGIEYKPGVVIGAYKLMEQIGEGGFGLVFVAEQQEPVNRRVALKIIKPGMESREVIARFEAERQALAMMNHQNIARILGGGVTDLGHPYFVMELVRGVPLIEFSDNHQLDTAGRLELFEKICHAVQHAHQKGIIHRDLKPSNIMVTLEDNRAVPKVIDFGIAKAIGQSLTEKTIYTRFNAMIGTPAYLSPEQAEMSNVDIDTRSDIYSLGILLYELLTGSTPFTDKQLGSVGFDEMRRIIRDEDPPRPSARLNTLGIEDASTVAAARKLEPSRLVASVRNDLDWIVMKAIDKDRNRRYLSAAALAQDVSRFLNDEPVEARPPSTWYLFSKLARRHKVAITTCSLVGAALVFGATISLWQAAVAVRERDKKDDALQAALVAKSEANEARAELEDFTDRLKRANMLLTSGRAHADSGRWEQAHADFAAAIETQPRYHHVWIERATLYLKLGLWERAASDFAKALEAGSPVDGPEWWGVSQLLWYAKEEHAFETLQATLENSRFDPLGMEIRMQLVASESPTVAESLIEKVNEGLQQRLTSKQSFRGRRGRQHAERAREFGIRPPQSNGFRPPHSGRGRFRQTISVWLYVCGWTHLNAGNYSEAIEYFERIEQEDQQWKTNGIHHPLLALALFHAGRADEAVAQIDLATEARNRWMDEAIALSQPKPLLPWFDWIEFLVNYRDAYIVVKGRNPVKDPRFSELHDIALEYLSQENIRDSEK